MRFVSRGNEIGDNNLCSTSNEFGEHVCEDHLLVPASYTLQSYANPPRQRYTSSTSDNSCVR